MTLRHHRTCPHATELDAPCWCPSGWPKDDTLPLFDPGAPVTAPAAHAPAPAAFRLTRSTDPATSYAAATSVLDGLTDLQDRVLRLFRRYGPMTQHDLIARYRVDVDGGADTAESTIRTRCAELRDAGRLIDSGARACLPSGRQAVVWTATWEAREYDDDE
jgi:hypothetical protein